MVVSIMMEMPSCSSLALQLVLAMVVYHKEISHRHITYMRMPMFSLGHSLLHSRTSYILEGELKVLMWVIGRSCYPGLTGQLETEIKAYQAWIHIPCEGPLQASIKICAFGFLSLKAVQFNIKSKGFLSPVLQLELGLGGCEWQPMWAVRYILHCTREGRLCVFGRWHV